MVNVLGSGFIFNGFPELFHKDNLDLVICLYWSVSEVFQIMISKES